MTRINCVSVEELTDQHLMAEYRELPMVGRSLQRSLKAKRGLPPIPMDYVLGSGHVTFFYDKGQYLQKRYWALAEEMLKRGFKLNLERVVDFRMFCGHTQDLYKNWKPDLEDMNLNRKRLEQRIAAKVSWYRYWGKNLTRSVYA